MTGACPRAVIFDCDGVIADSEPLHLRAFQDVLASLGISLTATEYTQRYLGLDDRDVFRKVLHLHGITPTVTQVNGLIEEKSRLLRCLLDRGARIFPGVTDFVRNLAGVQLAIASGALRAEVETVLRQAGIRQEFRVLVTAEDVRAGKPDPEGFLLALKKLEDSTGSIAPAQCLVVEDSLPGVDAAHRAGMLCLAVANSYPQTVLRSADLVVSSLEGLTLKRIRTLFD